MNDDHIDEEEEEEEEEDEEEDDDDEDDDDDADEREEEEEEEEEHQRRYDFRQRKAVVRYQAPQDGMAAVLCVKILHLVQSGSSTIEVYV